MQTVCSWFSVHVRCLQPRPPRLLLSADVYLQHYKSPVTDWDKRGKKKKKTAQTLQLKWSLSSLGNPRKHLETCLFQFRPWTPAIKEPPESPPEPEAASPYAGKGRGCRRPCPAARSTPAPRTSSAGCWAARSAAPASSLWRGLCRCCSWGCSTGWCWCLGWAQEDRLSAEVGQSPPQRSLGAETHAQVFNPD